MQLISKYNKGILFLLCVIDIFSKYTWMIPLKDRKSITVTDSFQEILHESKRKPNKKWVGKGSKFYKRSLKSWLDEIAIEMYSIFNGGKFVCRWKIYWNLKNKIYKYMTLISKNV